MGEPTPDTDTTTEPADDSADESSEDDETAARVSIAADAKAALSDLIKYTRVPTEGQARALESALHALVDAVL